MAQVRAKIREATDRRFVGYPVDWVVIRLNRVLRGWGGYFRHGNSARKFAQIDSYVHERLAIFASVKHGLHGAQLATPLHLGVAEGPGGLSPQRTSAKRSCACPAVNDVGKPCAGELHARFDRGPLADQAMVSRIPRTGGETRRTEPGHLQPGEPAAYLTT
jgi:hypothetical protein